MDASFVNNKRPFDNSTVDRSDPHFTPTSSTKRRHHHHQPLPSSPATPQSNSNNPFRALLKLSPGETLFRILCPASKTGGIIGKGGAIIRQVREETGAKIRIDDTIPGCDERVILIAAITATNASSRNNNDDTTEELGNSNCEESPAQKALVRVFERILKVDEERSKMSKEESEKGEENPEEAGTGVPQGPVVCRLLAASNQVGCVLGRGGKIIEKIRHESGAQVRVLPKDQLPECASPGDELIQMAGNFLAVRKALLSVSSCLQDNPRVDASNSGRPTGMVLHGSGTEGLGNNHRMPPEEDVTFKLLCQVDKVGSLIGKGGSVIRALQTETGASIMIADSAPDSDERVVVISAREVLEQRHSPAQDAVIRVHGRIAEIGFEPGAAIVARLLVHSQQIGCLWGKGGMIIAELRRVTGASIRIFPKEQVPKYGMQNEEVVQVIGSLQSVQDALFQITGRLRETMFPVRPYFSNVSGPPYMAPFPEMPPPLFRPRHDPASSPGYPSSVGLPRNADRVAGQGLPFESPAPFSHGIDRIRPTYLERAPYSYGNERPGFGPSVNRQSSPGRWIPQTAGSGNLGEVAEFEGGFAKVEDSSGRNQAAAAGSMTIEMLIPHTLVGYVYGENNVNLGHIKQMSGAKVVIHDPNPGAGAREGGQVIALSGTADETHTAQCLVHAFILSEHHLLRPAA